MTSTTAPLSAPLYGASFGQAFTRFFKKYATFSGRASRSEFWWWFLANFIISGVLYGVAGATGGVTVLTNASGIPEIVYGAGFLPYSLWVLATIVPWLALAWRRLHDTNKSGAFYFLGLIPFVGGIIVLIFFLLPSDPAGARFDK
ncbi:DUF805 domain-containing protein [Agromyces atrinae]|uniref:DUF805 domain-containing protein n=1 Tax=Agromyces atrinae TaxID=592376 RepID=A0A4Q2M6P5_9MICO|nr:DUF805 domain-containing protein [Agromyces atrinae]NYD67187.1 uncharacterized membrane protein YhaH (DUF805 family) [Agromyces atrinae]RXZ86977.1 DUF805 domain-containing protein [Agromyces atrinae]